MSIHLVRHGAAGSRNYAHTDDLERPLDQRGHEQAARLASHFAGSTIRAVWSSAAIRCIDTVQPTAVDHQLSVETFRSFTEGAPLADFVEALRNESGGQGDLIICSHGDLIPEALGVLLSEGMSIIGAHGCEKGSVWTLHSEGRDIVRATYERSPGID